jgi:ATP-dependent exoDNAse (exonuclease V) beta subunit
MANQWTPEQEAAMSIKGTTLLVSAAAGSGKTSVLTERIIRLLTDREHPADLSRMLIVTFTRASAADLKAKIAKALATELAKHPGDEHLTRQILSLSSAQISTIDSFFKRLSAQALTSLISPHHSVRLIKAKYFRFVWRYLTINWKPITRNMPSKQTRKIRSPV